MPVQPKSFLSDFKGFIFDIDGTLINSMKIHLKAWYEVTKRYELNLSKKEVEEQTYGINPEIVKRLFGDQTPENMVEQISNEKEALFRSLFDPEEDVIKGLFPFLESLHTLGWPMVIGSAAPPENVDFFMDRLEIRHYFKGIVHEDDVEHGKPSPEVFLKAAKIINVPPQNCVVFEDSPSGAEASAKAGSKTIAVLSSKSKSDFEDHEGVVAFIRDYTELVEAPSTAT